MSNNKYPKELYLITQGRACGIYDVTGYTNEDWPDYLANGQLWYCKDEKDEQEAIEYFNAMVYGE